MQSRWNEADTQLLPVSPLWIDIVINHNDDIMVYLGVFPVVNNNIAEDDADGKYMTPKIM